MSFLSSKLDISSVSTVWTVDQARQKFGVSRETFDKWISTHELPETVIGGKRHYIPELLLRHIRENKMKFPLGLRRPIARDLIEGHRDDTVECETNWPLIKRSEFIRHGPFASAFARRVIKEQRIPYATIGKMVFIDFEILDRFMQDIATKHPPRLIDFGF